MDLETELRERGLVMHEGGGTLAEILATPRKIYVGVDPTSDSLQVGNLVPMILMTHLARHGHEPNLLVGGGTGLIGDPKETGERPFSDPEVVAKNAENIRAQLAKILGKDDLAVINNADWLTKIPLIDFLRDIGKHFSVNQLVKRDIIKRRLETEEDSISYTEFSYSLLQAYDFMHLNETKGIDLQLGGSDQWANIISGVDLIRRKRNQAAYALTTPIVVDKTTGKKFGKSEGNAVWLDPRKTTPFAFYQFWINVADENVEDYLKIFTFLPLAEIADLMTKHREAPHDRAAQRALAKEITAFVHGTDAAEAAVTISTILYGGDADAVFTLEGADREMLVAELPNCGATKDALEMGLPLTEAMVTLALAPSKSEARRLIEGNGVSINGTSASVDKTITNADVREGLVVIRKGKKLGIITVTE